MAIYNTPQTPSNLTNASFRLWGSAYGAALTAGGWVKTTDTGQIDWTTAVAPVAAQVVVGYEVWRSNDAGGGLSEIYVKIEYGSGTASAANVAVWMTVGFASNGSGTLTGTTTARIAFLSSTTLTTPCPSTCSIGTGYFLIALFLSGGAYAHFWSVERVRDAAGAQTNEVLFCHNNGSNGLNSIVVNPTSAYNTISTPFAQLIVPHTNNPYSLEGGFGLQFGQKGGAVGPSINIYGVPASSFGPTGTVFPLEVHGVSRNYIIGDSLPNFSTNLKLLYRYE